MTQGELQRGAVGCSAVLPLTGDRTHLEASIGVVAIGDLDTEHAGRASIRAASELASHLA